MKDSIIAISVPVRVINYVQGTSYVPNSIKSNPKLGRCQNSIMRNCLFLFVSSVFSGWVDLGGGKGRCPYMYICVYIYICIDRDNGNGKEHENCHVGFGVPRGSTYITIRELGP